MFRALLLWSEPTRETQGAPTLKDYGKIDFKAYKPPVD